MAVNHVDGTLLCSVILFPVAAVVGAVSAGAGGLAVFFIPISLPVGCAVAYAGRKTIYGMMNWAG